MKVSLPIAGSIGTLMSGVVVSASNYRSIKAAGEYVIHNWKIRVDEISVEENCTGRIIIGGGRFDYNKHATLRWTARIKELDYKNLVDLKSIKVSSEVELRSAQKGEKLWTIVDSGRGVKIKLDAEQSQSKLKITLSDTWRGGRTVFGLDEFGIFECQGSITKALKGQKTYEASLERLQTGEYEFIRTKDPVDINVELATCQWNKKNKNFECNLKVTYEGSLDWSEKVTAKARISFQ